MHPHPCHGLIGAGVSPGPTDFGLGRVTSWASGMLADMTQQQLEGGLCGWTRPFELLLSP